MDYDFIEVTNNKTIPKAKPILSIPPEALQTLHSNVCTKYYTPIKGASSVKDVPFIPQKGGAFNKGTALWMINANIYTYLELCTKNKIEHYPSTVENLKTLYWHEQFDLFDKDFSCGYIANVKPLLDDKTNRILIAIRGTRKTAEWITDADISQVDIKISSLKKRVKIHKGFWDTFTDKATRTKRSLRDQIQTLLPQYLSRSQPNEIYVMGHSLGAAVSTLITLDLILHYPNVRIISYNIGCPRVGDRAFSTVMEDLAKDPSKHFVFWRLVNTEDIVPTVPTPVFKDLIYSHINNTHKKGGNVIGTVYFTENLTTLSNNHSLTTYYFGIKNLTSNH